MDTDLVHVQEQPARETIRDARGMMVGVIERQRLTGTQIARDARGTLLGSFDGQVTRRARGSQIVGRTNLLPALLLWGR